MRPTRPTRSPACTHYSLNNPVAIHHTIHTCHVAILGVTTPYGPDIIQAGNVLVAVLCIANTAEPPVSDHPKCEHLVVALIRSESNYKSLSRKACSEISTFWYRTDFMQFLSYDMCSHLLSPITKSSSNIFVSVGTY